MERKVVTTADGSSSIYVPALDEHYHSRHGAINESLHVFIKQGLQYLTERGKKEIAVLEIGFGTGLNAFLTTIYSLEYQINISYTGLEAYPVEPQILSSLNYSERIEEGKYKELFDEIHAASWESSLEICPDFKLSKIKRPVQEFTSDSKYDLVYFDAFAPNKQAEMWEISVFRKLYELIKPGGTLVSYCAKGDVRRTMIEAGFKVEKLPGPPYKREMLRAIKPEEV